MISDRHIAPGITLSELSRRLGRSRAALRKLARRGTIPCNPDGSFDEAAVRRAYVRNTAPVYRKPLRPIDGHEPVASSEISTWVDVELSATLIRRVLAEEGRLVEGVVTHDDARAAEAILRCRKLALQIAETQRNYIAADPFQKHVGEAFKAFCGEVRSIPERYAEIVAAELDRSPAAVHAVLAEVFGLFGAGLTPPNLQNLTGGY